ncbi:twitching motility protein PilU [Sulfurivirga caldicuralii]|uniref:Twitching motility protein PilU n=1 Tax=Sulfurivirga caldicuralii TaxID=364032 RepID=A0A1N6DUD5_9GAMM|nr:PilT/PilU family type 4a pilus ATPase [Sulfurivirga caldicuralii]SIN74327.1 twitching motility protein PilU [Sulfurivirga caldicuralii]
MTEESASIDYTKLLDELLLILLEQGGSDLYIEAGSPVAMRKDGVLHYISEDKVDSDTAKGLTYAAMLPHQKEEFDKTFELNFAHAIPGRARFRLNAFIQRGTPALVARTIKTEIPPFESLGLPPVLKRLITEKQGLILFVGGTGTGKSTSLASLIDHRNTTTASHIITIEDPIEFVHRHKKSIVTQREVGMDTLSYEMALKNTLRQAPDVIMIGEIRDRENMEHAVTFAETGHLCVSTLHANNAYQALDRIINFFPEERRPQLLMDLSYNLKAVVSQRLVPKVGGGRVAAVEILIRTPRVADLIFKGELTSLRKTMEESREVGMQTFDQHLFDLFNEGLISYEDALRFADSPNDVRLQIKLSGKLPPEMEGNERLI